MDELQPLIDQIPLRFDIVSRIVLLGIIQGVFLGLVILFRSGNKNKALKTFAWLLLIQSVVILDNHLCYTGLMKYTLHLNDSTEPLVLLLFPLIYLFIYQLLERKPLLVKKHWIHFLPAVIYALTQIKYYLHPLSVKYNAYLGAYHAHLTKARVPSYITYEYHWVKDEFRWMVLASCFFYAILSTRIILSRKKTIPAPSKNTLTNKYRFSRNTALLMVTALFLVFLVFLNHEDDAGDHYIGIFNTLVTFSTGFVMLSESRFFENSWIADKYETLGHQQTKLGLPTIERFIQEQSFFLSQDASLQKLARSLQTTTNHVSKVINVEAHMNFNEYINSFRVNCAKERLLDPKFAHLTIEAIGNSVGFKSKTAFYSAFKKHTKQSPKQYTSQHTNT